MSFTVFMAKVRHLDNLVAKWMMRHFYILFFQIFLVFLFLIAFINIIKVIDLNELVSANNALERLLLIQTVNSNIIVIILLLNSFWMLFIFNSLIRLRSLLKDVNFNLLRLKNR